MQTTACWAYKPVQSEVQPCNDCGTLIITDILDGSEISVILSDKQLEAVADKITRYFEGKKTAPAVAAGA